jgi:uncharacterized protein (TIGR03435 family)
MRSALFALAIATATSTGIAQGAKQAFEAASIKRVTDGAGPQRANSPDHFSRSAITLRQLVNYAYDLRDYRIIGGPDWLGSDRWQISAKASQPATVPEMRMLVRRLLADRYKLVAHMETRTLPVYELQLVRDDRRLGAGAKVAQMDCRPFLSGQRSMRESPTDANGMPRCAFGASMGPGEISPHLNGVTMEQLADYVATVVGRKVFDRTGTRGVFDISLRHSDEEFNDIVKSDDPFEPLSHGSGDVPSLFTALREQLGLKLISSKGPVEVLVIDSVQRPTEN